jgi:predicted metalloprotease with PDZ domain
VNRAALLLCAAASLAACAEPPPLPAASPAAPPPPAPLPVVAAPPPAASPRSLEIVLAPAHSLAGELVSVGVKLRFSEPPGEFGDPTTLALWLPGSADRIDEVEGRDADGPFALRRQRRGEEGEDRTEWRADRRTLGAFTVSYRVLAPPAGRSGAFAATGDTFVLLPRSTGAHAVRLRWDLSGAAPGTRGVSSLGAGSVEASMPIVRLWREAFLAGPVGRVEIDEGGARFLGAWIGKPAFDPHEVVPWAARVHASARAFFRETDDAPFALLVRIADGDAPRVTDTTTGTLLLAPPGFTASPTLRLLLARAIAHRWIGGALRLADADPASRFFNHALAERYAIHLLLAGGHVPPEEVLGDLNGASASLAFNTNDAFRARGLFYGAELDAALRAKSGGKRSLDALLLDLLDRARKSGGSELPADTFRAALSAELGPDAAARFDAVSRRGDTPDPPSDAFGACFRRVARAHRHPRGAGASFAWALEKGKDGCGRR